MMNFGYFEEAVLIAEFISEGLFEDTCFYLDKSQNKENKIKSTPLMHQKNFLQFKNKLFSFEEINKHSYLLED